MNMKKIISTALTVIMLLTSIITVIPVGAFAANTATSEQNENSVVLTNEEIQQYLDNFYLVAAYATAEEMLDAMRNLKFKDFIDEKTYATYTEERKNADLNIITSVSSSDGKYTIHIDRYTGFVFYQNNITGQILTSNPVDLSSAGPGERERLMSQIIVSYTEVANSKKGDDQFSSIKWAARYAQVSLSQITNGLRVSYVLGDTSDRFLLPGKITAKDFHDHIMTPMMNLLNSTYAEAMASVDTGDKTADEILSEAYIAKLPAKNKYTDINSLYYEYLYAKEVKGTISEYVYDNTKLRAYIDAMVEIAGQYNFSTDHVNTISGLHDAFMKLLITGNGYGISDIYKNDYYDEKTGELIPGAIDKILEKNPICKTTAIYEFDPKTFDTPILANFKIYSALIVKYCPEYTMEMMYADEKACGYEYAAAQKPIFECSLEYTFNNDGSLSVTLPSNSIEFDRVAYNLMSITPVQYFGCGDMSREGYLFYPDGSGSIIDYSDFYTEEKKVAVNVSSKVYGHDYCYSFIEGKHREQITMPVYGMISTVAANATTAKYFDVSEVKNGFFAIIEEGDSLASLGFESGGSGYKYISASASYTPYPIDKYELSASISVGSSSEWNTMVSEIKYSGNYVTRFVMLTDDTIGNNLYGAGNFYNTSYIGMATYYRDILKANGTLTAIESFEDSIPLYLEALGSMTILDKFLTFPIEKSIPLTEFSNVQEIYSQLSDAENYVEKLYNDYLDLADQANKDENILLEIEYKQKAAKYQALIGQIQSVKNVNFRLTGFANGGMNFTYPTKLKWESCCGGSDAFEELLAFSKTETAKKDYNLGIFPDFDFLYINNTAAFDGISNKGNVSRMVDNRYASKQVYNSVFGGFESFFSMVISSDTLTKHFANFNEEYSEYGHSKISVSTLGSDLNSNFDEKNTINREQSKANSIKLLEEMVYQKDYELMMDAGNIYAAKYATHILNVATDFSGFRYSSYAIPFVGMVLHSYVNYAGSPLNYSGSPDYDILRAIETGANPYYIVCFQNSAYMKDDETLSKYYGIDYENWYDEILLAYTKMNAVLAGIQSYEIVDHSTVIAERTADSVEKIANYNLLKAELLAMMANQLSDKADEYVKEYGNNLKLVVDVDALYAQFLQILSRYSAEIANDVVDGKAMLKEEIRLVAVEIANKYNGSAASVVKTYDAVTDESGEAYTDYIEYSSYRFTTTSTVFEKETYEMTDYTLDTYNVVMVTYKKGNDVVKFVLNYNLFDVDVRIDANTVVTIGSYDYYQINN